MCPHCGNAILVRADRLVTEEDALIFDWLLRLERFGISRDGFDQTRRQLSEEFGRLAGVNDTVWRVLNVLVAKHAGDAVILEGVYGEMANLVSGEGKDPTPYLLEAQEAGGKGAQCQAVRRRRTSMGHDKLAYVRRLRSEGKLDKAEELLMKAKPSPAVLDELRKIATTRARKAKKEGDWQAVVQYLEGYDSYAEECREYCIRTVNQEPPPHTKSVEKLLQEARTKLAK